MNKVSPDYILDNFDKALQENRIRAFYMPIIRASNGRVCHEEALARWIDPDLGIISPADFIPTLEESKLIHRLDLHIIDDVLDKMHNQTSRGLFLVPISINISRIDFESCDIVSEIVERLDASGISHDRLIIEVTEDISIGNEEHIKQEIERFQDAGLSVWMDDFGSGYSSTEMLQDINFDRVKLDMSFMKRFDLDKCKIMLTEYCRMFMSLGIKTIAEGVETAEQVEFLKEIGCNELQGFYYCKPLSSEEVFERYKRGTQIGFENPAESAYYDAIGTINLYDSSLIDGRAGSSSDRYFDTLPIVVYEADDDGVTVVRCNSAYKAFEDKYFKPANIGTRFEYVDYLTGPGSVYIDKIHRCAENGGKFYFDEKLPNGSRMHGFVRRIAENDITGKKACALIILEISEDTDINSMDFLQVAQTLSSDYISIYCINMDSGYFIEYGREFSDVELNIKSSGHDFFDIGQADLYDTIYEEDHDLFINSFTKEKLEKSIELYGTYNLTYRQVIDGAAVYVNLKAVKMNQDEPYIIIGINNIDAQIRYQKELDHIKEERLSYTRVMALAGNFICIISVDPDTLHYHEYRATEDYDSLGLSKIGEDFFTDCINQSDRVIYPQDLDFFKASLNKDKVLRDIKANGEFSMIYRLMLNGKPEYMNLKAVMVEEESKRTLVIGVSKYT